MTRREDDIEIPTSTGGFRWECPLCGTSKLNRSRVESGLENAVAALRTHIQASDGDEHGPRHELPDDVDASTLSEHVFEVSGDSAEPR